MKAVDQKSPAKRKTGRPKGDGFHGILTEEMMIEYGKKLFTLEEIGALHGQSKQNVHHVLKTNLELKSAFDKGHVQALEKITSALMTQIEKGNTIAIIFALKSKFDWIEAQYRLNKPDKAELPKVNIYLPDNGRDSINPSNIAHDAVGKVIN